NPEASVEVNGFADSVGNAQYNQRLSEKRAKNVAKILEQAGISSSRINVVANGEDTSFDGTNKTTSKFARRVTFKVN
ncbi:MAG TPA: OmpA family protein, partial [Flavobacterium sp.]|nr:OmpA family protein [Flavobacterium sp.]